MHFSSCRESFKRRRDENKGIAQFDASLVIVLVDDDLISKSNVLINGQVECCCVRTEEQILSGDKQSDQ